MTGQFTIEKVHNLLFEHYGLVANEVKEEVGYDDSKSFTVAARFEEQQYDSYVFKIAQNKDNLEEVCRQASKCLHYLHGKGLKVPRPVKTPSQEFIEIVISGNDDNEVKNEYIIQLFTYIHGKILNREKLSQKQLNSIAFDIGVHFAKIDHELMNFKLEQSLNRDKYKWNLANTEFWPSCFKYIQDPAVKNACIQINNTFNQKVAEKLHRLRGGIIHGDANDDNIVIQFEVDEDGESEYKLTGIIDFGDIMEGKIVFEIAIFMAYIMCKAWNDGLEPIETARSALKGFESVLPLNEDEKSVLYICVLKRLMLTSCFGHLEKHRGAKEEKLKHLDAVNNLAKELWGKGEKEIFDDWIALEHCM